MKKGGASSDCIHAKWGRGRCIIAAAEEERRVGYGNFHKLSPPPAPGARISHASSGNRRFFFLPHHNLPRLAWEIRAPGAGGGGGESL